VAQHSLHNFLAPSIALELGALDNCIHRDNIPFGQEGLDTGIANYSSQDIAVAAVVVAAAAVAAAAAAADSKLPGLFVAG